MFVSHHHFDLTASCRKQHTFPSLILPCTKPCKSSRNLRNWKGPSAMAFSISFINSGNSTLHCSSCKKSDFLTSAFCPDEASCPKFKDVRHHTRRYSQIDNRDANRKSKPRTGTLGNISLFHSLANWRRTGCHVGKIIQELGWNPPCQLEMSTRVLISRSDICRSW